MEACGYAHSGYAQSLREFGRPRLLPASGGWILERAIPGTDERDAMGCYPLFDCLDWTRLAEDLEELRGELVSLMLVPAPLGNHNEQLLRECFPDVCRAFKSHSVVDLERPLEEHLSANHLRNAKKALRDVSVEVCDDPQLWLGEWARLYDCLIARHGIEGISTFSRQSFEEQLRVPGLVMLRAVHDTQTVGMILWYVQGEVAYYHLAAYSDEGYQLRASFALFMESLRYFQGRLKLVGLGAGAGLTEGSADGLARFKRGWATGEREVLLCGRILDRDRYGQLCGDRGAADYFPGYRES